MIRSGFVLLCLILFISCDKDEDAPFSGGVDPNASLIGSWSSVAYDYDKTDVLTLEVDSVFSFTGALMIEEYQLDRQRLVNFLIQGRVDTFLYEQVGKDILLITKDDTLKASLKTLNAKELAYTIEEFFIEDEKKYRGFTSVQLKKN